MRVWRAVGRLRNRYLAEGDDVGAGIPDSSEGTNSAELMSCWDSDSGGAEKSVVRVGKGRSEVNSFEKGVEGCPSASMKRSLNRFPCPGGGFRRINS